MSTRIVIAAFTAAAGAFATSASADVLNLGGTRNPDGTWNGLASLETVVVGNPGNPGELSGAGAGGWGPNRICGAVAYVYAIGKYEVTAAQYAVFLNAVAAEDPYGLYNPAMWSSDFGCKIQQSGSPGNYTYSVAGDWANRPVNYVSYWDACRFANWLHNGQPTGAQGPGTTETGAYTLEGYNGYDGRNIQRNAGWQWAVTSEDEWYKAAYHKNNGGTAHYFDYPTSSDSLPSNDLFDPDPGNNATFYDQGWTIGSPHYRTEAGAHENSSSPYGTLDQGGNVWEWNEAVVLQGTWFARRGLRGGSFGSQGSDQHAANRFDIFADPPDEYDGIGFRVTRVPEPGAMALLALAVAATARRRYEV